MATPKLDGAGAAKLETLEAALGTLQTMHGIVEQMALSMRNGISITPDMNRLKRTGTPLVGLLKGQFGMISENVASMLIAASRGASDKVRLRMMREGIASIRMHLELQQKRVTELHTVVEDRDAQ